MSERYEVFQCRLNHADLLIISNRGLEGVRRHRTIVLIEQAPNVMGNPRLSFQTKIDNPKGKWKLLVDASASHASQSSSLDFDIDSTPSLQLPI